MGITVKSNGRKKIQTLDNVRAPGFRNAAILYGRETLLGARKLCLVKNDSREKRNKLSLMVCEGWIRCTLHLKSNLTCRRQ